VGMGVPVGSGANELQDVDRMTRTKSNIALAMIFIELLLVALMFLRKRPTARALAAFPTELD
ncbi:MAG: hypothetical protein KG029_08690, partial [Bacteroidetes bacterium]|nr:hypothetical protein [Bacteroidota bacterium]